MLPRIRERIANELRQGGGGNPFQQLNFDNNRNGDRNNAADDPPPPAPPLVRPSDLYLGCSTRVRRELLRINEWDRMIAIKDVWTKQVAEAPTQEDLDQQQQQNEEDGGRNNNRNNNNDVLNANVNLLQFLNGGAGGAGNHHRDNNNNDGNPGNENSDHDIREIMDLNIKKQRFRPAFYKVQFFNPTYAANLELLKLFHKRHAGNPKMAAQQFCRYWDVKLAYFGLEQLCKPLSLKALSSQDKACLHNGCMQLSRDDFGRTVLCLLPSLLTVEQANGPKETTSTTPMEVDKDATDANTTNNNNNTNTDGAAGSAGAGAGATGQDGEPITKLVCPHLVRALWYLVFRALQDKGETNIVIVLLGQDKDDLFGKTILHCTSVLREALPFHVVALHYLDGPGMSTLEENESSTRNDNFHWPQQAAPLLLQQQQQQDNHANEDMHGFGGLEQVAEWGGAVQMPDEDEDQDLPIMLPGSQDSEQQRRMLEKSKASLEHLEDRVGRNVRLRLRFHNLFQLKLEELAANRDDAAAAKDQEEDPFRLLRKRLTQFGIPNLPLNSDGTLIMHNPIDASSKRFFFTRPEHSLSSNLILPLSNDILLGKGRPYQEHPGNIALNDVIDKHRTDYNACKSRSEKTAMSQSIMESIQKQGGRFLVKKSKDDDLWIIAPPAKARDKIAHSFRLPRKHLKEAMDKIKQQKEDALDNDASEAPNNPLPPQVPLLNGQPSGGAGVNTNNNVPI